MMRLPESLEVTLRDELRQFEEENQMPYISSIERIGRLEGRLEGRTEERHELVRIIFVNRFGIIDEELETIVEPLTNLPMSELSSLLLSLSNLSQEELLARFGQNTP
ncbi:hypothetical protein NUACC21_39270 [Scytonema sp. NUACC21]